LGLDQHYLDRLEVAEFGKKAKQQGFEFIGLCCGAGPHQVRALAEALGRHPAASRYSPDMSKHALLGSKAIVKPHETTFLKQWK
jgi:betaine-homocysteine S-methyltransferase